MEWIRDCCSCGWLRKESFYTFTRCNNGMAWDALDYALSHCCECWMLRMKEKSSFQSLIYDILRLNFWRWYMSIVLIVHCVWCVWVSGIPPHPAAFIQSFIFPIIQYILSSREFKMNKYKVNCHSRSRLFVRQTFIFISFQHRGWQWCYSRQWVVIRIVRGTFDLFFSPPLALASVLNHSALVQLSLCCTHMHMQQFGMNTPHPPSPRLNAVWCSATETARKCITFWGRWGYRWTQKLVCPRLPIAFNRKSRQKMFSNENYRKQDRELKGIMLVRRIELI